MAKRNTVQKTFIREEVRQSGNHPTADEVYHEVSAKYPQISLATIYNNLNQMAEDGEIRRVRYPGDSDRYDRRTEEHNHFRCEKCGRIFDFDAPVEVKVESGRESDFRVSGYDLYFRGICAECRGKDQNQ